MNAALYQINLNIEPDFDNRKKHTNKKSQIAPIQMTGAVDKLKILIEILVAIDMKITPKTRGAIIFVFIEFILKDLEFFPNYYRTDLVFANYWQLTFPKGFSHLD